jgi:FkbM family methyltransferase
MDTRVKLKLNPNCTYSRTLFTRRFSAEAEIALMRILIRKGDTAIDVGANVGYITTYLSMLVGQTGQVLAIEPDPTTYQYLVNNLQINGCGNVHPYNMALSDDTDQGSLYLSKEHTGDNRMYQPKWVRQRENDEREAIPVECQRLDDLKQDLHLRTLSLVKVDVQGFETRVLSGGRNLIQNNHSFTAVVEFSPAHLEDAGSSSSEFWDLCEDLGLQLYLLNCFVATLVPYRNVWVNLLDRQAFYHLAESLKVFGEFPATTTLVLIKGIHSIPQRPSRVLRIVAGLN